MPITAAQLVAKVSVEGADKTKSELRGVGDTVGGLSGFLKSALSAALTSGLSLVGDGLSFLKDQLIDSVKAAIDHQQVMQQTAQALKSTGDVSGMTAQSIADLADKFSQLTPFAEDTTQSAENLLLTFTGIGKNVFPQATQAILDMSQAMGQDTKSSAVMLGKALNDPLTGLTALTRVGVTFSAQEKEQIKTMMQHNDVAGAQKVILKELETEFGGSATAAGKTFGGQLAIAQNQLLQLKEKIGTALLPILSKFLGVLLKDGMPVLDKFAAWFTTNGVPAIQKLAGFIESSVIPTLQKFGGWFMQNGVPALQMGWKFVQMLGEVLESSLVPAWNSLYKSVAPLMPELKQFGQFLAVVLGAAIMGIVDIISMVMQSISGLIQTIAGVIAFFVDLFTGQWGKLGRDLQTITNGFTQMLIGPFIWLYNFLIGHSLIPDLINGIVNWFKSLPSKAYHEVESLVSGLESRFAGLAAKALSWGEDLIGNLISGIENKLGDLGNMAQNVAKTIAQFIHFSKPDIGPLATADQWMDDLGDLLTQKLHAQSGKLAQASLSVAQSISLLAPRPALPAGVNALPSSFSQPASNANQQSSQPIYLQIDGHTFAKLFMPYFVQTVRNGVGMRF